MKPRKILLLRLSSLGDLVLASSVLEAPALRNAYVDWVVAKDFSAILTGHPKIRDLIGFDRKSGLGAWLRLAWELSEAGYEEVWDLHASLRSFLLRGVFWLAAMAGRPMPRFRVVSKARWRYLGYFVLKNLWPRRWRPRPWLEVFSELAGVSVRLRPRLDHLADAGAPTLKEKAATLFPELVQHTSLAKFLGPRRALAVMPSSAWRTKEWPVDRWVKALREGEGLFYPVILGTAKDRSSQELCRRLKSEGIAFTSFVGQLNLAEVAALLSKMDVFVGVDTGLYHMAAALDVTSHVILGPTNGECGYPPWAHAGGAIGTAMWCRPCGKNGQSCHRLTQKQACLKNLESEAVLFALSEGNAPTSPTGL